jgi:hypothetical protein
VANSIDSSGEFCVVNISLLLQIKTRSMSGFVLCHETHLGVLMLTKRNRAAIFQVACKSNQQDQVERVYTELESILPLLGEQSRSSGMIFRIGSLLLKPEVRVVAPSCPDYAHEAGKYTFSGVGRGVPLLTSLHLKLFDQLAPHLPQARFEIVIADQEAEDGRLCQKIGKASHEFSEDIEASAAATREKLGARPYEIHLMTKRFPTLRALEGKFACLLEADPETKSRLLSDSIARSHMYRQLGVDSTDEMYHRTVRTAAQYCALARLAAKESFLVCNHETVNLGWYNREQAAVLHNAVSIY